jgi:hypothetical protein
MKKIVQENISNFILSALLLMQSYLTFAQKPDIVMPGSQSINTALLHTGSFEWENSGAFSFDKDPNPGKRFVTVSRTAKEITIDERITDKGKVVIKRKTILNAKTFEPIRSSSEAEEFSYNLTYGSRIKGDLENYKTGEKDKLDVPIEEKFILGSSLEFLVSILPLQAGYKAFIPEVSFDRGYRTKVLRWEIEKVQEFKTFSCMSGGEIDAILVELSESYNDKREIIVDKKTRRIIKSFHKPGYDNKYYVDKEVHINPIKTKFDAREANALISQGTASISGQAYTTDPNKPKDFAFQRTKKIIAPKGSIVMLIPNTAYLKEWMQFNETIQKSYPPEYIAGQLYKGCGGYPLPVEVKEQTLLTEVTDNKGNFVFQNLKPGEYHVLVQFVATKYTHTTRTPTGGYTVSVLGDGTAVASPEIDVKHWGSPTEVTNYALVKIEKDGEAVKIKLK